MTYGSPRYIHELDGWPAFHWDHGAFAPQLAQVHFRRGALLAAMAAQGFQIQQEAVLSVLVTDVTTSSQIEGEHLDVAQVRSSIARRLGLDTAGLPTPTRHVDGVVQMMLDATQHHDQPLTAERLFGWHAALFPTGHSGTDKITVGAWRDDALGPMQVVGGPMGRETVHFVAPPAGRLPDEMTRFLRWFEGERLDPVLKAALAHLWFVTIHPFDDGNGRIARAIADLALARADGTTQRFYSMSDRIHQDRAAYYAVLERTQKRSLDVTQWLVWFIERLNAALDGAEDVIRIVRERRAFWDRHANDGLNERQLKVVYRLIEGFEGKLRRKKYMALTKTSESTALRDLNDLVAKGVLTVEPGSSGPATAYVLRQ